jgi:hypothetical protein
MSKLIILLLSFYVLTISQAQFCDPELQTPQGDPNAYQDREPGSENRCEGIYLQDVASSAISLTSFTINYDDFSDKYPDSLFLTWMMPEENLAKPIDKVHLRADSQVFKLYYRMDTVYPLETTENENNTKENIFNWSTQVVKNLQLTKAELGISAWLPAQLPPDTTDGIKRDVYLPLSILTSKGIGPSSTNYSVVVMPSSELTAIKYKIMPTTIDGYVNDDENQMIKSDKLEDEYYPSGQPVPITFSLDVPKGVYYLEIEVTRTNSKKSHLEIWFYHHGA